MTIDRKGTNSKAGFRWTGRFQSEFPESNSFFSIEKPVSHIGKQLRDREQQL